MFEQREREKTWLDKNLQNCYKLVQGFRVTCLFNGQYNTKGYAMVTDVI